MKFKIGQIVHGFTVTQLSPIPEVNADAYLLHHKGSGARLLYLDAPDDNNVFYIAFRTTPDNSKGTPHIMEHSTLCGSRKFPLKEPFVELAKGSLNTFLNAITWPDKTMYPVASRNKKDFRNLMDVYLDAVFYPECLKNPQILAQEGWHYELETREGELTYNGVVYNEMQGALSEPEAVMEDCAMAALFPDTTYSVESGGDPEVIPALTFREFTEFHRRFYHPSNSYIYLYGDMDIEETLRFLHEEYLSAFKAHAVDTEVATQSAFFERKIAEGSYGVAEGDDTEHKTIHALYTAMNDRMTALDSLGLKILNYTLIEMDGAPLKKAILDAGIGNDVSGSYNDCFKQPVWCIEVTGSDPEKQQEFADLLDSFFRTTVLNGADREMLSAALNRIEFTLRESDYQGRPKGLFYGIRAMDMWLYDRDPMEALKYNGIIRKLREGLETGFFEDLLHRFVVRNPHQVLLSMKPEPGLNEKKAKQTADKLAVYKSCLTDAQLDDIIKETKILKERQSSDESEEALATIPLLTRADLEKNLKDEVLEESTLAGIPRFHYRVHTGGITYVNLYFKLNNLSVEELPYAAILVELMGSVNTTTRDYREITKLANAYTGGIGFTMSAFGDKDDDGKYLPVIVARGKALNTRVNKLAEILKDILDNTTFEDAARLKEIVTEGKVNWDMTAFARGHLIVMNRLTSYFSESAKYGEVQNLEIYEFLTDILKNYEEKAPEFIRRLTEIAAKIFTRQNAFLLSVGEDEEEKLTEKYMPAVFADLPEGEPAGPVSYQFPDAPKNEGILSSGKVQYVCCGGNFRRAGFTYTAALKVMETVLRYEYLWKKIRVLGGAYGAFTQFGTNGNALLCSYRDPNLSETVKAYRELPEYLRNFSVSEREMTKYVIGTMAACETQLTPYMLAERAVLLKLSGTTLEDRLRMRREIIDCTVEDIRGIADLVESVVTAPYICVMGSEGKIRENSDLFDVVMPLPQ